MQNFFSIFFTILLIYFVVNLSFRLLFVIGSFLLKRSIKKRFYAGFKEQKSCQNSEDIIDAEFKEIKK